MEETAWQNLISYSLIFADTFEKQFIHQGTDARSIYKTLDTGLEILKAFNLLSGNFLNKESKE